MKLSIIMTAGAGLAAATPVHTRQTKSPLKPFLQRSNTLQNCGNPLFGGNTEHHSEPCVGTAVYCSKGYWKEYKEESFGSEEECLKAREPEFPAPEPVPTPSSTSTPEPTPEPAPDQACEADEDSWVWA